MLVLRTKHAQLTCIKSDFAFAAVGEIPAIAEGPSTRIVGNTDGDFSTIELDILVANEPFGSWSAGDFYL